MAIDFENEHVIYAGVIPEYYPRDEGGKKVHIATPIRHGKVGVLIPDLGSPTGKRRVKLELARCGGRLVTSVEAIGRFFAALNGATVSQDPQDQARDAAQLDAAGIP